MIRHFPRDGHCTKNHFWETRQLTLWLVDSWTWRGKWHFPAKKCRTLLLCRVFLANDAKTRLRMAEGVHIPTSMSFTMKVKRDIGNSNILLILQKSDKLTSWGWKYLFNPIICKGFLLTSQVVDGFFPSVFSASYDYSMDLPARLFKVALWWNFFRRPITVRSGVAWHGLPGESCCQDVGMYE